MQSAKNLKVRKKTEIKKGRKNNGPKKGPKEVGGPSLAFIMVQTSFSSSIFYGSIFGLLIFRIFELDPFFIQSNDFHPIDLDPKHHAKRSFLQKTGLNRNVKYFYHKQ